MLGRWQQNQIDSAGHNRAVVSAGVFHLYFWGDADNNKIEVLPEELMVMEELRNFSICMVWRM
jgi:hypothetical protein